MLVNEFQNEYNLYKNKVRRWIWWRLIL
jgi:protein-S-isoprenylcysteine O-methyltransferase Ste14